MKHARVAGDWQQDLREGNAIRAILTGSQVWESNAYRWKSAT